MINNKIGVGEYIEILTTTAPSSTTNKLYKVGSNLYWSGVELGGGGSGEVNTASNLGEYSGRIGIYSNKVGVDLQFKSLVAGSNITLTESVLGEILIESTGGSSSPTINIQDMDANINLDSTSDRIQILNLNGEYSIRLDDSDSNTGDYFIIQNSDVDGYLLTINQRISGTEYLLDYIGNQETRTYQFIDDRWHIDNVMIYDYEPGTDRRLIYGRGNITKQVFNPVFSIGSTIFGNNNAIYGDNKLIIGHDNTFSNSGVSTGVIIGASNIASAGGVIIGHGNISSNPSNIIIGYGNNINSNAIIVGEISGTIGLNNITILGTAVYQGNIDSTISIGRTNTLSANSPYSQVIGYSCESNQSHQIIQGYYSVGLRETEQYRSGDSTIFNRAGYGTCSLRGSVNELTNNLVISLAGQSSSRFEIFEDSITNFSIRVVIYRTNSVDAPVGGINWRGVVGASGGVASFIGVPIEESWLTSDFDNCTLTLEIESVANDYLNIKFTRVGANSNEFYIYATIEYSDFFLNGRTNV